MSKLTFDEVRKRGLLLYEYVRGSKLYHTDTPDSDEDTGGVFIAPIDFDFKYQEEVSDEKNDSKWWELGKFMEMAMTSNPAVLEAFFVPDELVKYVHPMFKEILKHGPEFVTKACFKPFGSYAVQQIKKAQGQNKKIHWDMEDMKRKTPIDFCFTYDGRQGSINIQEWLERYGLRQDCCGLVNLTNMKDCYLMYYDFGQHFRLANTDFVRQKNLGTPFYFFMLNHFKDRYSKMANPEMTLDEYVREMTCKPLGEHCGIINNDGTSNTVRLCSTQREEEPICMMTYNADGYGTHCRKYKEYEEWKQKRNKARYESNMEGEKSGDPDMKYDVKNMYHSFRNVAMCTEIAQGKGIIPDRTGIDRDFLMDVRARKFGYSELIKKLAEMTDVMQKACDESTIKEQIDEEMVRRLTSNLRRKFFEHQRKERKKMGEKLTEDLNKANIERMYKVLDKFLGALKIQNEDVMLTGSLALKKHNMLPKGRFIHDVDIVIKANETLERDIQTMNKIYGNGGLFWQIHEDSIPGVKHKPYILTVEGVKLNIWIQDPDTEFDTELTTSEGYKLATVRHILNAKKSYGRGKDVKDILDITVDVASVQTYREDLPDNEY